MFFVKNPMRIHFNNSFEYVKNHMWFIMLCCAAVVLHIYSKSLSQIITAHSKAHKASLRSYDIMMYYWDKLFDFPVQVPVWLFIISLIFIIIWNRRSGYIGEKLSFLYGLFTSNYYMKTLFIIFVVAAFLIYSKIFPYISLEDQNAIKFSNYPPLGTLLQLGVYVLFSSDYVFLAPLIVQFTFYIFGALFLYKTIRLFLDNKTALLGASILLFSPIVFTYATLDLKASGTIFFIILVSYFFLKFIRDGNNEDMILTAYFISLGVLYRRVIIVMFFACCLYLIILKIKRRDLYLRSYLMMLSVSVVTFIPWFFIGTRPASKTYISHFYTDYLLSYLFMIPTQISWPIFALLLLSVIYILLTKRNHLSLFFGLVFMGFYAMITLVKHESVHRYVNFFYPFIAVFLAQFLYYVSLKLRWRYAFNFISITVIIYLAILCIIPRSSTNLITFRYEDFENQHFPVDEALEWILSKTGKNDKVFRLYLAHLPRHRVKEIPRDKVIDLFGAKRSIDIRNMDVSSLRQSLKEQCKKQKVSYLMFPGGDAITMGPPENQLKELEIRKILKEDKYDDFIEAAKFNIDDNYIYIYKVRDSFINSP
jgi:hypothetical protein